ncbi:MAG TPA: ribosomal protein S18-alanine N-acetyltransferase [Virgibacillus sp.]|nr:ribosomal protein S18-alanine N-acetyltransferase [Virgibacillus sp.]
MNNIVIRKMETTDIQAVLDVEEASFTTPWPEKIFYQELINNKHAHYFVLVVDEQIVGYAGLWIIFQDVQVTNIAILPEFRRMNLGEKLFQYICHYAIKQGAHRLSLEVRASNIAAQRMYRKFGLVPGGIRKQYYTDNKEDAIIMWVNLL